MFDNRRIVRQTRSGSKSDQSEIEPDVRLVNTSSLWIESSMHDFGLRVSINLVMAMLNVRLQSPS